MHRLVEIAKETVEAYVRAGKVLNISARHIPGVPEKAGVFVSIKKHGNLRGCIGTFMPDKDDVVSETISNAIAAATKDPRFDPVTEDELDDLDYSVDVLGPPEKVDDVNDLDPKKYGIILKSGFRRGLLLPDLEGVDTVEDQIRITKMKAGIAPGEKPEIFRFTVVRYS
ncbi:MAG: AmmeMemoRadiSam system protein A [Nitrospirae bacterium]|nr:AmmeMemoRadiSam system protein A [Nitrospirota bacterium]